ncbi:MAG TPA: phosphoglucomutase/phosphomannomutase family protein [Methylomirabilota bacterium]|nr:phosphoglucomutase/phosphomannomutase family protein [Methylomirabilota bacterium]
MSDGSPAGGEPNARPPLTPIRFGTSGWRARIAGDFTFANVRRLTAAIAEHLVESGEAGRGVVVGYDTRFLSEDFAATAAGTLAAYGVRSLLSVRDVPTPVVAHAVRERAAAAGITITASHNPAPDNGIKLTGPTGAPALPEVTKAIEARVARLSHGKAISLDEARTRGLTQDADFAPAYLAHCRKMVDLDVLGRARLRLVVDVMHGPARGYLDHLLREAGADVTLLHGERDVTFGGHPPEPAEEHLGPLIAAVREQGAHLGLATDGDADRFGIVDRDGAVIPPNPILALVLRHLLRHRKWRGGVARSVATTHLLDALAAAYGCPLHETPVGFKYVGELITQGAAIFGGEESGGMSLKDHPPEKDGILAGLLVAELTAVEGVSLGALLERLYGEVGRLLSIRINVPLSEAVRRALPERIATPPPSLGGARVLRVQTTDGLKLFFDGGGWVLVRPSGTEPVARLYVEAPDDATLGRLRDAALGYFFR